MIGAHKELKEPDSQKHRKWADFGIVNNTEAQPLQNGSSRSLGLLLRHYFLAYNIDSGLFWNELLILLPFYTQ